MTLQGDLATLDLAALLQNLESNARSGTLSVDCAGGKAQILFEQGKIAAFARDGRTPLIETLVAAEAVGAQQLARVRQKHPRSRRPLGELLVEAGAIEREALLEAARSRLLDDVCELVCAGAGEFAFHQGPPPRGVFDPEERALELALPAGPLLLEAARRADHWAITRAWIPSDAVHFVVQHRPELPEDEPLRSLAERLLARLDGTRSVAEAVCAFPHQRFEAHELLAAWLKARRLRAANADELLRIAERLAPVDVERARAIAERGLEEHPRHGGLLAARARLAEEQGDAEAAVESLKLLAHASLAAGRREEARDWLERALELAPEDAFLWQRSFELARQEGRTEAALTAGERLAELLREPGLHKRAAAVYAELAALAPESWKLARALAHARVDGGEVDEGVAGLERFGRARIAAEDYAGARAAYAEVLELLPAHAGAREALRLIDEHVFEQRRARRRRRVRLALTSAVLGLLGWLLTLEITARAAFSAAQRSVSELGLIEAGRYAEAIAAFEAVRRDHPWAPTSLFDVRSRIADLHARDRQPALGAPAE